jgi:hypothetical protein
MRVRYLVNTTVLLLSCMAVCLASDAAAEEFLVTVLRSSDPVEVRELLGLQGSPAASRSLDRQRSFRTSGYRQRRHRQWQVVVSAGQTAYLAIGSITPQLQIPWVALTRHGPVPHASLAGREDVHGIVVQVRRLKHALEVTLYQFDDRTGADDMTGRPGPGLRTVLRGRPGQWLDAGGNLMLDSTPPAMRHYSVGHSDPRRFRLLVRLDPLD